MTKKTSRHKSSKGKRLHRKTGHTVTIVPVPKEVQVKMWTVALESLDDRIYLLDKQQYFSDPYKWRTRGRPLSLEFLGQTLKKVYA